MEIREKGMGDAAAYFAALAARCADLEPAFEAFGAYIVKTTDDGFRNEREADGTVFAPLAVATIDARIAKVGGFKRTRKGSFTKGALKKQARLSAPGGIKILTDTARARNSQHTVATPNSLTWSAVGYLGAHMAGTSRVPKRNPTPFVRVGNGWALNAKAQDKVTVDIRHYVQTGEVRA